MRKGGKLFVEWRDEKMGGDNTLGGCGGEAEGWGGGGDTPGRAAVDGKRDELKMRAGGDEETAGGDGEIPQGGLDCLSFCRL